MKRSNTVMGSILPAFLALCFGLAVTAEAAFAGVGSRSGVGRGGTGVGRGGSGVGHGGSGGGVGSGGTGVGRGGTGVGRSGTGFTGYATGVGRGRLGFQGSTTGVGIGGTGFENRVSGVGQGAIGFEGRETGVGTGRGNAHSLISNVARASSGHGSGMVAGVESANGSKRSTAFGSLYPRLGPYKFGGNSGITTSE